MPRLTELFLGREQGACRICAAKDAHSEGRSDPIAQRKVGAPGRPPRIVASGLVSHDLFPEPFERRLWRRSFWQRVIIAKKKYFMSV